jgi:hypothetical protein
MAEALTMRRGLLQMLETFHEGTIEHVLVTTFNFDPGFFERNVLPLFCGLTLDDLKTKSLDALARDMYYPLKKTQVVVAYDQSVLTGVSGGGLRYSLLPKHLSGGFFHAKIVVLLGKNENGNAMGAVMVGSGNMTLSGWANNVEVAGFTLLNKRNAQELDDFYHYLNAPKELGLASELLSKISDEQATPELFLQYPNHTSGKLFDRIFPQMLSEDIHIYSPYWSEEAIRSFASEGKVICYPAKGLNGFLFPVAKQELVQDGSHIEVKAVKGEEHFRHAKAYFWDNYSTIGSANCTMQALHTQGNVEAMLRFDSGNFKIPEAAFLDTWSTDSESEEGLKPAPVGILVVADYQKRAYEFELSVSNSERCSSWTLTIGKQKLPGQGTRQSSCSFESNQPVARLFRVEWQGCDGTDHMTGMIIPRGGNEVELGFRPKRNLTRIFDDMLRHRSLGTAPLIKTGRQGGNGGGPDDLPDDSGGEASAGDGDAFEFDMYGMYQSFFHLRKDLVQAATDHNRAVREDEIADTLLEILQAVKDQEVSNDLQRWLMLQECMDLAKRLPKQERFLVFSSLETELTTGIRNMLLGDKDLGRYRIDPDSLLSWVRKELGYAS